MAFVKEHGGAVLNPSFDEYACHFERTHNDLLVRFPALPIRLPAHGNTRKKYFQSTETWKNRCITRLGRITSALVVTADQVCPLNQDPFLRLTRQKKVLFLLGWNYRNYAAFDRHADLIRQQFQPVAPLQASINAFVAKCRTRGDVLVGVHVRRGDYKEHRGGRFYYEPEQYAAAMKATLALIPGRKVHFLICSNEAITPEAFAGLDYSPGPNHLVEDLYSFAQCDYLLGAPSTYTMWASFMGQVPLYQIFDPNAAFSLDDFRYTGGNCDVPEDIERWVEWQEHK